MNGDKTWLLDDGKDFPEVVRVGPVRPLKNDGFGGGNNGTRIPENLYGRFPVFLVAGTDGIFHHLDPVAGLNQVKPRLQYTDVGFHACNHDLRSVKPAYRLQEILFQAGAEKLLLEKDGFLQFSGNLWDGFSEAFSVMLGDQDGNLQQCGRSDQLNGPADDFLPGIDHLEHGLLNVDQKEQAVLALCNEGVPQGGLLSMNLRILILSHFNRLKFYTAGQCPSGYNPDLQSTSLPDP